jgi:hypothetical protein
MLKKAENKMAFAKIGLYGDAGSGKTVTAALLAIGIHKYAKLTKPIGMFDTEPGASFIIPLFEKAGIEFLVFDQSRALVDLMAFMREAEEVCSIALIDSVTHIWRDVQESYLKKINERNQEKNKARIYKLEFHHWNAIKPEWGKFTDLYLHSKMHAIVCGRAGSIYEYQENDKGKKELITVGTKMATEKEMGYEPSLLIELMKHLTDGRIINRALVEKDRSMNYNGVELEFSDKSLKAWVGAPETLPKPFTDLIKHFEALNLGGQHFSSMRQRDSSELFTSDGDNGWDKERREREIWAEEIKGLLIKHGLDGTSNEARKRRMDMLQGIFGTMSWTAIENKPASHIREGFEQMRIALEPPVGHENEIDINQDIPH